MATAGFSNPYLGQQANALQTQANQNLQYNLLPGVNSGAQAAGGYGGSRQGIAQGLAIGQTQQGLSSALGNMYSTAYNNDQNLANQYKIASMQDLTNRYASDNSLKGSMYGADRSLEGVKYSSNNALKGTMYSSDNSLKGTMYSADRSLEGAKYSSDNSLKGTMYSADAGLSIASMNNATTQRGQDMSTGLGYAGLQNQANIAGGQLGLGYAGLGNQLNIAGMQNATTQRGQDQSYNLGMGNLALGFQNSNNSYDLGLRQNDLGYAGLDAQIAQNNFNNQMTGANFGLNIYDRLQQANNLGITAGGNIQNTPLNYWSQFSNAANSIGQGYGTTTASGGGGNPLMGAIGGAQLGQQLYQNWGNIGGTFSDTVSGNNFWAPNFAGGMGD